MLKQILETRQQPQNNETPAHHIVNGSNAMLWTVRDARQFSIDLMTAMFKKEEMAGHLAFISAAGQKKTKKTTLPREKVCS